MIKKTFKIILGIVFFTGVIILSVVCFFPKKEISLLEKKGYTGTEINHMKKALNGEQQKVVEAMDYRSEIPALLEKKQVEFDYLDRYLAYQSEHNTVPLDSVVDLVNADIDKMEIEYDPAIIDILKETYFIKDELKRYLNYHEKIPDKSFKEVIADVNSNIDYQFYTNSKDVDLSKGNLIIVNKYHKLDEDFVPTDLVTIDRKYGYEYRIKKEVYEHYRSMCEDALLEGLTLFASSPYRSYQTQKSLYNNYVKRDGKAEADRSSARPGYSEHQTGLAIDMVSDRSDFDTFQNTMEYSWLQENAQKYGFIMRYPKNKEYLTGYIYEPWHYRYVGVEVAAKMKELGITFEEYYAYFVK